MPQKQIALHTVLNKAATHPFYKKRLLDCKKTISLNNFPITTKTNFIDLFTQLQIKYPMDDKFWHTLYWSPSGGTTGNKRRFYFPTDLTENHLQRKLFSKYLKLAPPLGLLNKNLTALCLFSSDYMNRTLEIFTEFCELCGCTILPVGYQCSEQLIFEICAHFKPNVIIGSPPTLVNFASYLHQNNLNYKFKKIITGAEQLHAVKRTFLEDVFNTNSFNAVYGSSETGIWAFQPDALETNFYFVADQLAHLEILEPDSNGFGKIIVTNLIRKRFPVIRFDTGDLGKITTMRLSNKTWKILNFISRGQSSFSIGSEYYDLNAFEPLFKDVLEWQFIISYDQKRRSDYLLVKIVLKNNQDAEQFIEKLTKKLNKILLIEEQSNEFFVIVQNTTITELIKSVGSQKIKKIVDLRSTGLSPN